MVMCNYPSGYIGEYRSGEAGEKIVLENLTTEGFFQKNQIKTIQVHAAEGEDKLVVRVRLSMHKLMPIPPGFMVPFLVSDVWVSFAYEFLPGICSKCGLIGHHKSRCSLPEELNSACYSSRNRTFTKPEGDSLLHQHHTELVKLVGDALMREEEYSKWIAKVSNKKMRMEADKHLSGATTTSRKGGNVRPAATTQNMEVSVQQVSSKPGLKFRISGMEEQAEKGVQSMEIESEKQNLGSSSKLHIVRWEPLQQQTFTAEQESVDEVTGTVSREGNDDSGKRKTLVLEEVSAEQHDEKAADNKVENDAKKRKIGGPEPNSAPMEFSTAVSESKQGMEHAASNQEIANLKVVGTDLNQSQMEA